MLFDLNKKEELCSSFFAHLPTKPSPLKSDKTLTKIIIKE